MNPKPLIDPFGSLILPALALILVAARGELLLPVFAYAKPMPVDPSYFKNPRRDQAYVVARRPAREHRPRDRGAAW